MPTNPWMQDTRSLNSSGDFERRAKKSSQPKQKYSGLFVVDPGSWVVLALENSSVNALR